MNDLNLIIGIVLLLMAVVESVMARLVLPRIFEKMSATKPQMDAERASQALRMLNNFSYVAFAAGLLVLIFKPLNIQ